MLARASERSDRDWLSKLPARCLAGNVEDERIKRRLVGLPLSVTIAELKLELTLRSHGPGMGFHYLQDRNAVRGAIRELERTLKTRGISEVRPRGRSWVIPDEVGFSVEGRSPDLSRRRETFLARLDEIGRASHEPATRRSLSRVVEVLSEVPALPNWLYWYSPATIHLVRAASHETLQEFNHCAALAVQKLEGAGSISTWEESVSVVARRLPVEIVNSFESSRRGRAFARRLSRTGITCLGGATVASTDSLYVLRRLRLGTLESLAGALRGGLREL